MVQTKRKKAYPFLQQADRKAAAENLDRDANDAQHRFARAAVVCPAEGNAQLVRETRKPRVRPKKTSAARKKYEKTTHLVDLSIARPRPHSTMWTNPPMAMSRAQANPRVIKRRMTMPRPYRMAQEAPFTSCKKEGADMESGVRAQGVV
jgi:hypothetical protein